MRYNISNQPHEISSQSKMHSRFADVDPIDAEPAIDDYIYCKLVTLEEFIKSLIN